MKMVEYHEAISVTTCKYLQLSQQRAISKTDRW